MLTTNSLEDIDSLVRQLSSEENQWNSLAIAIDLADEIMKLILPDNLKWQEQLSRDVRHTGKLPTSLPRDTFNNQKELSWFHEHPESSSARSAFIHFYDEDSLVESKFYWFSESATKSKISVATSYSPNWEDSELTHATKYKVGIDFFLSGDTNTLLMVTSSQHKLRVLEFNGKLSNTQKQILQNNLNNAASNPDESLLTQEIAPQHLVHQKIWNALQLKEVNKNFYKLIADHFNELVVSMHQQGFQAEDSKQFSSRLLGRLLFVWFLRKMDIINENMDYFNVDDQSSSDYYENHLKTLFFNTLNTEVNFRNHSDVVTPYLNGGLFEAKYNDFAGKKIMFPDSFFKRLYDHFDEFNFTVDESSPDFELIAVDPEMLGQVFESLLASQIDDDGNNERNKKGAFYTPRPIVNYMVKETLRQYLYSQTNDSFNIFIDDLLDLPDSKWSAKISTSKTKVFGENTPVFIKQVRQALDNFKVLDPAVGSGAFPMGMLHLLLKTYERIEKKFDPYKLKLAIIEKNIFGVDIEPMAIEIARLRAWLSVIVDEPDKQNIKPLPNLDFKFISANSLVKLEIGQTDLFSNPNLSVELSSLRDNYFNARSSNKKKSYQEKYYQLTDEVSLFDDERSKQLKSFDPFKNRYAATFFDSQYMFGVTGFDAVIGNPPYIHFDKSENKELSDFYKKNASRLGFVTYTGRGDIYTLFYEKGLSLLNKDGLLSFITSNKWMRAQYGKKLRNLFVTDNNPLYLIDLGPGIFESATVDSNILLIQKKTNSHHLRAVEINDRKSDNLDYSFKNNSIAIDYEKNDSWIILNEIEQGIKQKIESVGIPLKDWNININRGVLTGLNEAFIISKEKRDELINEDPNSSEIIHPLLRGKDIRKNKIFFRDIYLINTHNGYTNDNGVIIPPINIEEYPAIKNWLDYGDWNTQSVSNFYRLSHRTDKGITPYNLRNLAYMPDFYKNKIVYSEIVQRPQFYFDTSGEYMIEATAFLISGDKLNILTQYLNNRIVAWIFKKFYAGGGLGKGYRYKKAFIENIRIPNKDINLFDDNSVADAYDLTEMERDYIIDELKKQGL